MTRIAERESERVRKVRNLKQNRKKINCGFLHYTRNFFCLLSVLNAARRNVMP